MEQDKWLVPDEHVWAFDGSPEDNKSVHGVTAEGGAVEASSDKETIERGAFYVALGGWNDGTSSCMAAEAWHVLVQRGWDSRSARFAIEQLALGDQYLRDQAGFGDLAAASGRYRPVIDAVRLLAE